MLKMIMMSGYLLTGAVVDIRRKSVPLIWVLFGAVMTGLLALAPVIAGAGLRETATRTVLGAGVALPFVLTAWLKPRHLGRADAAVILMIGLLTGAGLTVKTLFIALALGAVCGSIQVIRHRSGGWKTQAMAFLPCLAAGFIGAQFL